MATATLIPTHKNSFITNFLTKDQYMVLNETVTELVETLFEEVDIDNELLTEQLLPSEDHYGRHYTLDFCRAMVIAIFDVIGYLSQDIDLLTGGESYPILPCVGYEVAARIVVDRINEALRAKELEELPPAPLDKMLWFHLDPSMHRELFGEEPTVSPSDDENPYHPSNWFDPFSADVYFKVHPYCRIVHNQE